MALEVISDAEVWAVSSLSLYGVPGGLVHNHNLTRQPADCLKKSAIEGAAWFPHFFISMVTNEQQCTTL